jgi:hypothetical protein
MTFSGGNGLLNVGARLGRAKIVLRIPVAARRTPPTFNGLFVHDRIDEMEHLGAEFRDRNQTS